MPGPQTPLKECQHIANQAYTRLNPCIRSSPPDPMDVVEGKMGFARAWMGCETFLSDTGLSAEENVKKLLEDFGLEGESIDTHGEKVNRVIQAPGAASSVDMGIHLPRPGVKYIQTGLGNEKMEFPIMSMSQKELMMVRGCFRHGAGDYELVVEFLEKKVTPCVAANKLSNEI